MSQLTEEQLGEWLSGYLDGEVDARERAFVEHLLREDPRAAPLLAELRGVVAAVAALPRHAAPPSIAGDVRQFAERTELLGGAALAGQVPRSAGWKSRSGVFVALAAMIGITLGVGLWYQGGGGIGGWLKGPVTRERVLSADAESKEMARERRTDQAPTNLRDADRPITEETYAQFVTEVLALVGPTIDKPRREPPIAEKVAYPEPSQVLALNLRVADRAAARWAGGEMGMELRKLADMVGGRVSDSNGQDEVVATAKRRGMMKESRDGSKAGAVQTWKVSVPMSELPRFAEAVLSRTAPQARVTLAAGMTEISGSPAASEALRRVDQTWRRRKEQRAAAPPMTQTQRIPEKESPSPPPPTGGIYGGLLEALGLQNLSEWVPPGTPRSSVAPPLSGEMTALKAESPDAAQPDGAGSQSSPQETMAGGDHSTSEGVAPASARSEDIGVKVAADETAAIPPTPRSAGEMGRGKANSSTAEQNDGAPTIDASRTGLVQRRLEELERSKAFATAGEKKTKTSAGNGPFFPREEPWVTVAITVVVDVPERPSPVRLPGARRGNGNDARPAGR